jgi:two-component system sensor histidine kinase/response regulator
MKDTYTILVVEDEEDIRENVSELLESANYRVFKTDNGTDAVNISLEVIPDLILCDIHIPGLNGYGVLKELSENDKTFNIPFVFLTARNELNEIRHGMSLGADDYITKPFKNHQILESVEKRIQKKKKFEENLNSRLEELRISVSSYVPHEMRTPLNTIIGFSQMLSTGDDLFGKEELKEIYSQINSSGMKLLKLIDNYTIYNKLTFLKDKDSIKSETINYPEDLINEQVLRLKSVYNEKNKVKTNLENAPVKIHEFYFSKMIEEILENAFKFSEPGSEIEIDSEIIGDRYMISVNNTGQGFSKSEIEKIGPFMQFRRDVHEQQGIGLGLAIVEKILDVFGGSLQITGDGIKNTNVHIFLQVADA